MRRLEHKIAIVTGAGHGIGRAISELYAAEGGDVIMCSMNVNVGENVASGIRKSGGKATFIQCDVSQPDQIERVVKAAAARC